MALRYSTPEPFTIGGGTTLAEVAYSSSLEQRAVVIVAFSLGSTPLSITSATHTVTLQDSWDVGENGNLFLNVYSVKLPLDTTGTLYLDIVNNVLPSLGFTVEDDGNNVDTDFFYRIASRGVTGDSLTLVMPADTESVTANQTDFGAFLQTSGTTDWTGLNLGLAYSLQLADGWRYMDTDGVTATSPYNGGTFTPVGSDPENGGFAVVISVSTTPWGSLPPISGITDVTEGDDTVVSSDVLDLPPQFIAATTGTNTATAPSHQIGDLILVIAYRDGLATAPTLASGFTSIGTGGAGSTNAMRAGWKIAQSTSETIGTWTNATSVIAMVFRGAFQANPIGSFAYQTGASTTITYPNAGTMANSSGSSTVVRAAGHRSTNVAIDTAPSGYTLASSVVDATDEAAAFYLTGATSAGALTAAVGGTSSGFAAVTIELRDNLLPISANLNVTEQSDVSGDKQLYYTDLVEQDDAVASASFSYQIPTTPADIIVVASGTSPSPSYSSGNTARLDPLPELNSRDIILCFAYRRGSATSPSLPSGWTSLSAAGSNTNSLRIAWKFYSGPSDINGTTVFTNANSVTTFALRNVAQLLVTGVGGGAVTTPPAEISGVAGTLSRIDGWSQAIQFFGMSQPPTGATETPTNVFGSYNMDRLLADNVETHEVAVYKSTEQITSAGDSDTVSAGWNSSYATNYRVAIVEVVSRPENFGLTYIIEEDDTVLAADKTLLVTNIREDDDDAKSYTVAYSKLVPTILSSFSDSWTVGNTLSFSLPVQTDDSVFIFCFYKGGTLIPSPVGGGWTLLGSMDTTEGQGNTAAVFVQKWTDPPGDIALNFTQITGYIAVVVRDARELSPYVGKSIGFSAQWNFDSPFYYFIEKPAVMLQFGAMDGTINDTNIDYGDPSRSQVQFVKDTSQVLSLMSNKITGVPQTSFESFGGGVSNIDASHTFMFTLLMYTPTFVFGDMAEADDTLLALEVEPTTPLNASIAEANDTVTAASRIQMRGQVSVTEGNDSASSAFTVVTRANVSVTESNDTVSSTFTVVTRANVSVTEANDTLSMLGQFLGGSLIKTEDDDMVSSSSVVLLQANSTLSEEDDAIVSIVELIYNTSSVEIAEQSDNVIGYAATFVPATGKKAIQYIGANAGTTTATLPTYQIGDLIVVFAYRDGNTTAPTLPTGQGWTTINTSGANTQSARAAYKFADTLTEAVGTFTNATSVIVAVYRNVADIFAGSFVNSTATSVTYTPGTNQVTDGSSWYISFAGHRSTNTSLQTPPTAMTNRVNNADTTDEVSLHDTNGGIANFTSRSVAVGGTQSGWISLTIELEAALIVENHAFHFNIEDDDLLSSTVVQVVLADADINEDSDTVSSTFTLTTRAVVTRTEQNDAVSSTAIAPIAASAQVTEDDDTVVAVLENNSIQANTQVTEADDTVSATGVLPIVGSSTSTEANDTISSTSTVLVKANAAITEADDSISSASVIAVKATVVVSEADDTVVSSGLLPIVGSADNLEEDDAILAESQLGIFSRAFAELTEDDDLVSSTSALLIKGSASITEADDNGLADADLPIAASLSQTEESDTVASTAAVLIQATSSNTEQSDTVSATSALAIKASVDTQEADDSVVSTSALAIKATVDNVEADDSVVSYGFKTTRANASVTEIDDTSTSNAVLPIVGASSNTEEDDFAIGISELDIFGTLQRIEQDDTVVSVSKLLIQFYGDATEDDDTVSFSSKLDIKSQSDIVEQDDVSTVAGRIRIDAVFIDEEDDDTIVSDALVINNGYLILVEDDDTGFARLDPGTVRTFMWTGTEWKRISFKVWSGNSWDQRQPAVWDGSDWIGK